MNQKSGNDKKSVSASEGRTRASAGVGKSKTKNSGFRWRPGDYSKVHCREYDVVGGVNQAGIELKVKNIGSATLTHPLIMAVSSNNKLSLQLKGANYPAAPNHYRSQLGGNNIFDFLPFRTSKRRYDTSINVGGLSAVPAVVDFDVEYNLSGENLEEPFGVLIHVHFTRE